MTLEELEDSLPNGLHDAELVGLRIDYPLRRTILTVNVDLSDVEFSEGLPDYRTARLVFSGVQFAVIDPPEADERSQGMSPIAVGIGEPTTSPAILPPIAKGCFLCWIYVLHWNSFIRISAMDVVLDWAYAPAP